MEMYSINTGGLINNKFIMFKKKQLQTSNETKKTFNFSKGSVSLNFTLRVDIKTELKDFLELLKASQLEIENQLK